MKIYYSVMKLANDLYDAFIKKTKGAECTGKYNEADDLLSNCRAIL